MKIQKRAVKANTELLEEVSLDTTCDTSCYECAIEHILSAIDCLGEIAKEAPIARESIANLSVVLFDLKN